MVPNSDLANAIIPKRYFAAYDSTGYQFVQRRGLIVLQSAIGMLYVRQYGSYDQCTSDHVLCVTYLSSS